jgi:hypothetical protein
MSPAGLAGLTLFGPPSEQLEAVAKILSSSTQLQSAAPQLGPQGVTDRVDVPLSPDLTDSEVEQIKSTLMAAFPGIKVELNHILPPPGTGTLPG